MMPLRDILVVLDDTPRSDIRLSAAVRLAQRHEAHLTGISALDIVTPPKHLPLPYGFLETEMRGPVHLAAGHDQVRHDYPQHDYPRRDYPFMERGAGEITEQIEIAFRTYLRSSGLRWEWRVADGRSSEAFARPRSTSCSKPPDRPSRRGIPGRCAGSPS